MKQSKLRRKRVFRYAVLYFVMFVVFVALIAGPVVVGNLDVLNPEQQFGNLVSGMKLVQPNGLDHDDTRNETETGPKGDDYTGVALTISTFSLGGNARATRGANDRMVRLL